MKLNLRFDRDPYYKHSPPMPRCFYCKRKATTKDHILPKPHRITLPMDTRATRPCCEHCNHLRATCHHCPAILLLLRGVARELFPNDNRNMRENYLAAEWGLRRKNRGRLKNWRPQNNGS